ncbi:MAG: hypothetical protein LQ346_008394 [Caloplaca aetnensis]|nr:MAG: hypothetical protein LQ346_008394 [Caloplaca aetnensis]
MAVADDNRIQKNKTDSPLLRLPAEILEKIVILVVGGQTVHIRYENYLRNSASNTFGRRLSHSLCTPKPPKSAEESESDSSEDVDADGQQQQEIHPDDYSVKPYINRHRHCLLEADLAPRLSLTALRVSRQIYAIADHALLSQNTFAFRCPYAFTTFMRDLHPARKAQINKLELALRWDIDEDTCRMLHGKKWATAVTPGLARAIGGLKRLEVDLDFMFDDHRYHPLPPNVNRWTLPLDELARIQLLRPRAARVIVSENQPGRIGRRARRDVRSNRLGWEEKRDMAGFFEKRLLEHPILHEVPHEAIFAKWKQHLEVGRKRRGNKKPRA